MGRGLRATGAFLAGLVGTYLAVMLATSVVLGGLLGASSETAQSLGGALFLPLLVAGSLLGVWLARRSLARTGRPTSAEPAAWPGQLPR